MFQEVKSHYARHADQYRIIAANRAIKELKGLPRALRSEDDVEALNMGAQRRGGGDSVSMR